MTHISISSMTYVKTKVMWQANEHLQLDRTRHVDTVALVLSFVVQCKPLN
jgi:hypothetical protein